MKVEFDRVTKIGTIFKYKAGGNDSMRVANRSTPNKTVFDELKQVKMSRCLTHLILSSISQCARSVPFFFFLSFFPLERSLCPRASTSWNTTFRRAMRPIEERTMGRYCKKRFLETVAFSTRRGVFDVTCSEKRSHAFQRVFFFY